MKSTISALSVVFWTALTASGCYTAHGPAYFAHNVPYLALTPKVGDAKSIGEVEGEVCDDVKDTTKIGADDQAAHGLEQRAFDALLLSAKKQGVRYLMHIESDHYDTYVPIPLIGGTTRCVDFTGEGFK